jgi:hypothetical protein
MVSGCVPTYRYPAHRASLRVCLLASARPACVLAIATPSELPLCSYLHIPPGSRGTGDGPTGTGHPCQLAGPLAGPGDRPGVTGPTPYIIARVCCVPAGPTPGSTGIRVQAGSPDYHLVSGFSVPLAQKLFYPIFGNRREARRDGRNEFSTGNVVNVVASFPASRMLFRGGKFFGVVGIMCLSMATRSPPTTQ